MAVSYGLPAEEGLKAVTLYPAQILGVADQLGSIEVGKRANLVLTNGDILQATSRRCMALFIDGQPLEPTSKHTRLYERYRERLARVQGGPNDTRDQVTAERLTGIFSLPRSQTGVSLSMRYFRVSVPL